MRPEASITPPQTLSLEQRIEFLEKELKKGFDPSKFAHKSITADKFRKVSADFPLYLGNVAPGGWSVPIVVAITTSSGISEFPNYIMSDYWDIFVDPADVTSGNMSLATLYAAVDNIYPHNVQPGTLDNKDRLVPIIKIRRSTGGDVQELCQVMVQIKNEDTVFHNYYIMYDIQILATALTGGQ